MKRLNISLILLALLIAGCVSSILYTDKIYHKMDLAITQCETAMLAGDTAAARQIAEQTEAMWTQYESRLVLLINHDLMNEIGLKVAALTPYAAENTIEDFFAACKQAKIALLHMRNDHMLSKDTIF